VENVINLSPPRRLEDRLVMYTAGQGRELSDGSNNLWLQPSPDEVPSSLPLQGDHPSNS